MKNKHISCEPIRKWKFYSSSSSAVDMSDARKMYKSFARRRRRRRRRKKKLHHVNLEKGMEKKQLFGERESEREKKEKLTRRVFPSFTSQPKPEILHRLWKFPQLIFSSWSRQVSRADASRCVNIRFGYCVGKLDSASRAEADLFTSRKLLGTLAGFLINCSIHDFASSSEWPQENLIWWRAM